MSGGVVSRSQIECKELEWCIAEERLGTYGPPHVTLLAGEDARAGALRLYDWHMSMAAALLPICHGFEVVVRNAASDAIEAYYGPTWPWAPSFVTSLPTGYAPNYNAQEDLRRVKRVKNTTGTIIAELKFVFWEKMFTSRHDGRLWKDHLRAASFPNMPVALDTKSGRGAVREQVESVRLLRNRIAHHEPILDTSKYDIGGLIDNMHEVISWRSAVAHAWLAPRFVEARAVLDQRPI